MARSLQDHAREWLDTLVVAISVAMAFRAYFYEPFNIPTGSMQPALYGNHYQECKDPGVWETTPLKWLNWLATGRDYKEIIAPFDGVVHAESGASDGRTAVYVSSALQNSGSQLLPDDALSHIDPGPEYSGRRLAFVPIGSSSGLHGANAAVKRVLCAFDRDDTVGEIVRVKKGRRIFSGYDTTGDFVFVNRWKWNFRLPARSDVMVFSTTGINGLMQGTHYIKRVTALPGETVEITGGGDVLVDGRKMAPLKPMTGRRGEKTPAPNPGILAPGEYAMKGPVKLGEYEYFTCGDNSDNSLDSRYWGAVPEEKVTGNASCVFWPIINPRWGTIK